MPLLDHFHGVIEADSPWESFHTQWAGSIAACLNHMLPRPRFRAHTQIHLGTRIEADVAEMENILAAPHATNGSPGGVAVATKAVPAPSMTTAFDFPDNLEVQVFDTRDSRTLVAVIELVSPGNKDRADSRSAFVDKCAAYLYSGVGLAILDIVSKRRSNLHNELLRRLNVDRRFYLPDDCATYAVSYHPARRHEANLLDGWTFPLAVGQSLPDLPLALKGTQVVILPLEETYQDACDREGLS